MPSVTCCQFCASPGGTWRSGSPMRAVSPSSDTFLSYRRLKWTGRPLLRDAKIICTCAGIASAIEAEFE